MYRSAIPRRQSSHLQTSLEDDDKELAESVESVRSKSAGGRGDGGEDGVKQAPAFSILATSSVSISDRGLTGAETAAVCVWMLPEDAGVGGGVELLTSEVMLCNPVNDTAEFYVHSYIHTLVSILRLTKTQSRHHCFERLDNKR
jgi:hypothetical protein